jgi:thioredoxin-dependent peroxiredoxin
VRDEISQFEEYDVRPLGVNPASVQSHASYAAKLRLPFPLLSDPELAVARAYGAVKPDGDKVARSVCLIDYDGTILFSQSGAPGAALVLEPLRSSS